MVNDNILKDSCKKTLFFVGLVDNGETIETAALRELKEETGYSGSITGIGRNVSLDPGMSSATMKIVTVKVSVIFCSLWVS